MTKFSNLTDEELNRVIWAQVPQALKAEIASYRGRADDHELVEMLANKLKDSMSEEIGRELAERGAMREVERALTSLQPITKIFESVPEPLRQLRLPAFCCISPFETERGKRVFQDWADVTWGHIGTQLETLERKRSWKLRTNVKQLADYVAPVMRDAPAITLAEALKEA
jgi:hypothetical protein